MIFDFCRGRKSRFIYTNFRCYVQATGCLRNEVIHRDLNIGLIFKFIKELALKLPRGFANAVNLPLHLILTYNYIIRN